MAVVIDKFYAGAAVQTTVVGSMTPSVPGAGQTFTLSDATGWPGGAGGQNFVVVNSVGLSNEEKILATRSGTTCTVVQRGYDGTTPQTHSAGSPCEHRLDAATMTSLRNHVDGLEATPHSGVLLDNAAHDVEARHTFGAALGTPVTPTALTPDIAGAAGTGNNPAREDHAHNVPAAAAVTSGLSNTEGTAGTFARSDHTHDQAALSVGSPELIDGSIANGAKLATGQQLAYVQSANPGAVGANALWFQTTKRTWAVRNAANTGWEILASGHAQTYTPTLFGVSVGAGQNHGRYRRSGNTIIADGIVILGAGGSVSSRIGVGLPVAAKDLSGTYSDEFFFHAAGRASDFSSGNGFGAIGVVGVGTTTQALDRMDFFVTAGGTGWDATTPFTWTAADGDRFSWFAEYEPASLEDTNFV